MITVRNTAILLSWNFLLSLYYFQESLFYRHNPLKLLWWLSLIYWQKYATIHSECKKCRLLVGVRGVCIYSLVIDASIQLIFWSPALWKRGLLHLLKVSTYVNLHSSRRLTRAETFRYIKSFCLSKNHSTSWFSKLFDKIESMDPLILHDALLGVMYREDALSPLYGTHTST